MENKDKQEVLITAALDMLESVETVIENKEVTGVRENTYEEYTEEQPKVTSQPTFRGEDRQKIKDWLIKQLV